MSIRLPKSILNAIDKMYVTKSFPFFMYHPQFHQLKGFEIRQILDILEPGDILLRRMNGYLTSMAIPGYWTHASISIDDQRIAHAVGKGTCVEDMLDWFRCDGCAVLRPKMPVDVKEVLATAMEMIKEGVPYDYSFKADNGMVYCTEFVNLCYNNLFSEDFENGTISGNVLLPRGIYHSEKTNLLIEFKH